MNPSNLQSILELINAAIKIGGDVLPIALRAYAALKAESGMSDDQFVAALNKLNPEDGAKLAALIAETS
jgi:hypothetical protein